MFKIIIETDDESCINNIISKLPQLNSPPASNTSNSSDRYFPERMDTKTLAEYTGYSKDTIYGMIAKNTIPFHKRDNSKPYFSRKEIDRWLFNNQTKH